MFSDAPWLTKKPAMHLGGLMTTQAFWGIQWLYRFGVGRIIGQKKSLTNVHLLIKMPRQKLLLADLLPLP